MLVVTIVAYYLLVIIQEERLSVSAFLINSFYRRTCDLTRDTNSGFNLIPLIELPAENYINERNLNEV